jgi:hypothetical protein
MTSWMRSPGADVSRYVPPGEFRQRARRAFAFLVGEGFVATSEDDYRLAFVSSDYLVEIAYDERNGRLITLVEAYVGERTPRASLECLYVAAGLAPAQRVRQIARTLHSLDRAVESQSSALRELLPVLVGPGGQALLLGCHGS